MTMHFSNREDILDSRDIIERFEELTSEKEALLEQIVEAYDDEELYSDEDRRELQNELNTWIDEHGEEHRILSKLNAQGSDYAPDWEYGDLDDDGFMYRMLDGETFYSAWADAMDWTKWEERVKEKRDEILEELRAEEPDYEPPYRCTETPDLFTGV